MMCKYCGGTTKVEECAGDRDNVFRRRVCKKCHKLMWTREVFAEDKSNVECELRALRNAQFIRSKMRRGKI